MNKKIIIISIIISIFSTIIVLSQSNIASNNEIFHVILADSNQYKNGIYSDKFTVEKGEYVFKFVPNGDSPKSLTISLKGSTYDFSENFKLKGILHKTEISEYYTWEYDGQKEIQIPYKQDIDIEIDPNGNKLGSVSVYIVKI